ncbi:zf-RING_2 domain-containing protein [Cephalotus follicularis]|uniref:RING-type E3 ubiquitin transferase n=1 Tax=Cephalotus follicularis TaxID=3775 RepID=A0A1Q3BVS1_CEPFO|nr:zf-RING_2 domain-containing protein [Cephalotus follicularis]
MASSIWYYEYCLSRPDDNHTHHNSSTQHNSSIPIDVFKIVFEFGRVLRLCYPPYTIIPVDGCHKTFYIPRNKLLSPLFGPRIMSTILSDSTSAPQDIVDIVARKVVSFAFEIDNKNHSDSGINRVLTMALDFLVTTPYDDRSDIDRVINESMQEGFTNFKPATGEAIRGLERERVVDNLVRFCDECRICLEEFVVGSDQFVRMPCNHVFHADCIVKWLKTSHLCPLCRYPMPS